MRNPPSLSQNKELHSPFSHLLDHSINHNQKKEIDWVRKEERKEKSNEGGEKWRCVHYHATFLRLCGRRCGWCARRRWAFQIGRNILTQQAKQKNEQRDSRRGEHLLEGASENLLAAPLVAAKNRLRRAGVGAASGGGGVISPSPFHSIPSPSMNSSISSSPSPAASNAFRCLSYCLILCVIDGRASIITLTTEGNCEQFSAIKGKSLDEEG